MRIRDWSSDVCSSDRFSSRCDLSVPALQMRSAMRTGQRSVHLLSGGRLPVVAAVQGSAFGAGFSLAIACDFVVVDANSSFGDAFGRSAEGLVGEECVTTGRFRGSPVP